MKRFYYFYRNNMIERFGKGWCWTEEMCRGYSDIPIYKTIGDAKNAIDKYLDGTHKSEPRIVQTAGFSTEKGFYIKED